MAAEIQGQCPIPPLFGLTLVNRSWKFIQREYEWSFLWVDFAIPTPPSVSSGSVTVSLGSAQVIGDATATAVWNAFGLVIPITTRQFRVGQGTIYSIIAYDTTTHPPFGTLTLDKPFVDNVSVSKGYQIYKCYYNSPVQDFIWFDTINDPITGYSLRTTMTRQESIDVDPQRLQGSLPAAVIPYDINLQPGNFYGYPRFEIWPPPLAGITYTASGTRAGSPFVNYTDAPIPPLDEDVVIERGKVETYEWAIANPDKVPKGDFRFLLGKSLKEYRLLINQYIMRDEATSHRHKIPYAERRDFYRTLPWVSQLTHTATFADVMS